MTRPAAKAHKSQTPEKQKTRPHWKVVVDNTGVEAEQAKPQVEAPHRPFLLRVEERLVAIAYEDRRAGGDARSGKNLNLC